MPCQNRVAFVTVGLAAAAVGASVGVPKAQEAVPPNPSLTFSVGERLELSDNPEDEVDPEEGGAYLRTDLGLLYLSQTRVSSLSLGIDTTVDVGRFGDDQGTDSRLETLGADIAYSRESARSDLSLGTTFRRSRLDDTVIFDDILDDDFEPEDLVTAGGFRERTAANLDVTLGKDTPLGAEIGLFYTDTDYEDAGDADPRRSYGGEAALRTTVSPVLDLGVVARLDYDERDDEENFENEDRTLALTASYAASEILSLSGEIGRTRSETTRTVGDDRVTETNSGPTFAASAAFARPSGTVGVSFQSSLDEGNRRNEISAARALEYSLGTLAVSVGLSENDGDVSPIFGLDYSRETRRGALSVAFDRSVSTEADTDRTRSRLEAAYRREITAVSSWNVSVDYAEIEETSGDGDDTSRLGATLSYRYDLTREWEFATGYRYALVDSGQADERQSNTIFFGISRDFTVQP